MLQKQTHGLIRRMASLNGHPPLGVNATTVIVFDERRTVGWFQWAPTLGGECYEYPFYAMLLLTEPTMFQWAPTLGGECYTVCGRTPQGAISDCFNGHPPLGVNATRSSCACRCGKCSCFNGHPPLGVNATVLHIACDFSFSVQVSMGTHPWG